MKIFIFGIGKKEQPVAEQWAAEYGITLETSDQELNAETISLAKNADAVSFQQMAAVHDEATYQKMADYGIRFLSTRSAGIDGLSKEYLKKYNIKAANVPVYSPRAIAEHALTLSFMLLRHMPRLLQREQQQDFVLDGLIGREIHDLTVGIIGTGHIGLTTAELFRSLGANVIGYDKFPKKNVESILTYLPTIEAVAEKADILSLHTPYTPENHHLIDEKLLRVMKPDALIINTARGPLIDTKALLSALEAGTIGGAGLDTLENEDLYINKTKEEQTREHPYIADLLALDTVIVTPHIAFYTLEASKILMESSLNSLLELEKTGQTDSLIPLD
ncbi:NAD(P)-dependent oxidoreductase [Enterococcus sp. BWR-S5]|uniref:NAD(P)-dependent oxidoreductase n=1 Tax=Enterococcus sp. BWR-S5 TaxID=2787714 RepID=UPI0019214A75|nr:NAD(P)-dependent oxidoreductase [Enterococcus sp. BWR-S5]MBL1227488.1 D-2-hydroxyacid dehydrogenase [Enterococcus sp. BWR-S5]